MNGVERTRFLKFLLMCFPVRVAFVVLMFYLGNKQREEATWYTLTFGAIVVGIGIGLAYFQYLRDSGKRKAVGFAGGKVYWNSYVHSCLWILAAVLYFINFKYAWVVLLLDTILGLGLVLRHYLA